MDQFLPVFAALRNGTILDEIPKFDDKQLRPFLPFLIQIGFKNANSMDTELGPIRTRLIKMPVCNNIFKYIQLDFADIEMKCNLEFSGKAAADLKIAQQEDEKPFVLMNPLERVLRICAYLIWTKDNNTREQLQFRPLDIGRVHTRMKEEIGWILAVLCTNCPNIFAPNELAKQLLNYELAPTFITTIVMNQPESLESVLDPLILQFKQPDDESFIANQTKRTILELFQLDPQQAERFMPALLENEKAAKRVIHVLSSESIDDHFYVNILIAQFSNRQSSEFVAFITKAANKPSMKAICQRLGTVMERCSLSGKSDLEGRVVLLISLLASWPSLRLITDESRQWVSFLTRGSITDDVSLKISLATILASPNLILDQNTFRDEQIGQYLAAFFSRIHSLVQLPEYSQLSNMMILIYVHLITDNAEDLASLLSTVLGHKVPKTLAKQPFVRELYIQYAINQQDIVQKAANINVTKHLNAEMSGYLPLHCICAMLHWRSFSKYSTPIQEWIKAQLLECRTPIHPFVAHLLENFATSCIPSESFTHFNQPIDERFFEELFSGDIFDESRLVLRILSLTYLVAFNYKLETVSIQIDQQLGTNKVPKPYSQHIWHSIPIRYLLIMVDIRHEDFQHIRPMLQRYMVLSMPHLLPEQMHFDSFKSSIQASNCSSSKIKLEEFSAALNEPTLDNFSKMLNLLLDQPIQQQFFHYSTILRAMGKSLDSNWPPSLVEQLALVWEHFDCVVPSQLHEDTIRLWLKGSQAATVPQLDERDSDFLIRHTPLVLFRADKRVFQSPPHLRCFCRLLSFYLASSRDANSMRLAKAAPHNTKVEMAEKEELLRSFIGTQRLAVVQLFIELCDGNPETTPHLVEIRQLLCAQIHQFFIADAHLPKLVHFNMYPIRLIPIIVRGVPSAHVVISAISELVTPGNLERRIFAIVLITELLEQYKIPSAFAALTIISDMLDTLISNILNEEFIVLMLNVVPSLRRLVQMSPFHAEYFLATMQRTRKLAINRMAIYISLNEARASPEQKLVDLLDQTLEELPKLPNKK